MDTASIRSCADLWKDWTNGLDKAIFLMRSREVKSRLDNVVGKRITEKSFHLVEYLLDNHVLGSRLSAAQALLNHVGAELVPGELADTALERGNNGLSEGGLVQVDDVLDNIVSKRVLHQYAGMLGDALNQPQLLLAGCVINAALEHTAAMSMGANLDTVVTNGIKNKLRVRSGELVKALLDDVVSVQILDEFHNTEAESFDDEMNLLRSADILNHLLEGPCSMLVESDAHHVFGCVLDQDSSFVVIAELEELLAQIITKRIRHELDDMLIGLEPNHVNLIAFALLQLLLEIAAAVLVLAQLVNLASE